MTWCASAHHSLRMCATLWHLSLACIWDALCATLLHPLVACVGAYVCHLVAALLVGMHIVVVLHERWHWQCGALVQDGHVVLTGLVKLSCCIHVSFCPTHPHHYCMSVPLRVYSPVQLQPHWCALLSFALGWLCCTLPIALAVALW